MKKPDVDALLLLAAAIVVVVALLTFWIMIFKNLK